MKTHISRGQAFVLHLLCSALLMLSITLYMYFILYPGQLFYAANGIDMLKILALVDVVLGPLIMLIIFNPKKKSLKLDVSIILIFQLAFLIYGCWSFYVARPAYVVFNGKAFELVRANEIDEANLSKVSDSRFKTLPYWGPTFVGTLEPKDNALKEEIELSKALGAGIKTYPQLFTPYEEQKVLVVNQGLTVTDLKKIVPQHVEKIISFASSAQRSHDELLFIPLVTSSQNLYVAIDKKTGTILKII